MIITYMNRAFEIYYMYMYITLGTNRNLYKTHFLANKTIIKMQACMKNITFAAFYKRTDRGEKEVPFIVIHRISGLSVQQIT